MNNRHCIRAAVTAALTVIAAASVIPATAGTATNNLTVSATVVNNCAINSTTPVAFGNYDPAVANNAGGADVTATGDLVITCTTGATTTVYLDQGANPLGSSTAGVPARQMVFNTTHFLAYFLYQDNAQTNVWGATVGSAYAYTGSGNADTIPVYGDVPKGQNVPAGAYADTVLATVNF